MGTASPEIISAFMADRVAHAMRLKGIVETADSIYLGAVGLSRHRPSFHSIRGLPFSGVLSDSARFYLEASIDPRTKAPVLVAIFRQFESSRFQSFPEDILMGWLPSEESEDMERWLAIMAQQLTELLALKHAQQAPPT